MQFNRSIYPSNFAHDICRALSRFEGFQRSRAKPRRSAFGRLRSVVFIVSVYALLSVTQTAVFAEPDSTPTDDMRIILAGHPGAFVFASIDDRAATLDDEGVMYLWRTTRRSDDWQVEGGVILPDADDLRAYESALYVRSDGLWHRIETEQRFALHAVDDDLVPEIDAAATVAPNADDAFMAPIAATPLSLSSDRRLLVTDLGCMSFDSLSLEPCADSGAPEELVTEPTLHVEERDDSTCESGSAYSVVARFPREARTLIERSCAYPLPVQAHDYDGRRSWIVFLGREHPTPDRLAGDTPPTRYGSAVRFDANLNATQRIRFPAPFESPEEAYISCRDERCHLDVANLRRSYAWPRDGAVVRASAAPYAIFRSAGGTLSASSGQITITTGDKEVRLVVTSEGGASTCGWAPALTSRVLTADATNLYVGAGTPAVCERSVGSMVTNIVTDE